MSTRVTLSDVAADAGVHPSTVSRALNEATRSLVSSETVDRVLAAADRLGYRPHPLARGLRTNRTMTVGFVIPDVENPLFGPIIAGAEAGLAEDGYSLLIADDRGDPHHAVSTLVERHVDGLIMASAAREDAAISPVLEAQIPVVFVNRYAEGVSFPAIVTDDDAGIGLVVEHLAALGHRRIGHVAGPQRVSTGYARTNAFVESTTRREIFSGEDAIEEASWFQVEPGYRAAKVLLDRRPDLTAIVGGNDLIALGCYRAIRERRLEVGRDISVTGYNDIALLDLMQPGLTSVRVPFREMGWEAANRVLALIGTIDHGPVVHRLEPSLVMRDSTAPVR